MIEEKKDLPLLSIITVVFNDRDGIKETILSVNSQSYTNYEHIIIDGGSTDGTVSIIKENIKNIEKFVTGKDRGIYDAMNKAISLAKGDWLNFMNSGDTYNGSNAIKDALGNAQEGTSIIYSDTIICDKERQLTSFADFYRQIFVHQSIIYKKNLHEKYGYYLVANGVSISDYIFFCQLKDEYAIKVNAPISVFKTGGISSNRYSFYQKVSFDFFQKKISKQMLILILMLYPLYRLVKRIIR